MMALHNVIDVGILGFISNRFCKSNRNFFESNRAMPFNEKLMGK